MNYPLAAPINYGNATRYYADTTGVLGSFYKTPEDKTQVTIDYSNMLPTTQDLGIAKIGFKLDIGTQPPLLISGAGIQGAHNIVVFIVSGGVAGVTYKLNIVASLSDDETVYNHLLEIFIPVPVGADCGCGPMFSRTVPFSYQGRPVSPVFQEANILNGNNSRFGSSFIGYWVSTTPPRGANILDHWFDPDDGVLYERATDGVNVFWHKITAPQPYSQSTPPDNPFYGDIWINPTDNSLNFWTGTDWFNIPAPIIDTDTGTSGSATIYYGATAPTNPTNAELWSTLPPNPVLSIYDLASTTWYPFVGSGGGGGTGAYLQLSGGTLTGPLMLAADPTIATGAATKNYVDTATLDAGSYDSSSTQVNVISIWDQGASTWDQGQAVWTT
jgi:hypothetical protein